MDANNDGNNNPAAAENNGANDNNDENQVDMADEAVEDENENEGGGDNDNNDNDNNNNVMIDIDMEDDDEDGENRFINMDGGVAVNPEGDASKAKKLSENCDLVSNTTRTLSTILRLRLNLDVDPSIFSTQKIFNEQFHF